jgi:hypothetical protein
MHLDGRGAEKSGGEDWGETLKILVQDIDAAQLATTIYDTDPDAAAKLADEILNNLDADHGGTAASPPAAIPLGFPTAAPSEPMTRERKETLLYTLNLACHPETTTTEAVASLTAYQARARGLLPSQIWGEHKPAAPIMTDTTTNHREETFDERQDRQDRKFKETMEGIQRAKDEQWKAWREIHEDYDALEKDYEAAKAELAVLKAELAAAQSDIIADGALDDFLVEGGDPAVLKVPATKAGYARYCAMVNEMAARRRKERAADALDEALDE